MVNLDEWDDITPIAQDDCVDCVVSIAYDKEYKSLMGIFRAVVQVQEKSERVVNLTSEILKENAANYTVWQYRRECLLATGIDLNIELDYLDNFSDDNPKNYQIWHHRRVIVENMKQADRELEFCHKVFSVDCKNYHAWAHRQWTIKTYDLWNDELAYIDKLLVQDVRNNSAWNHRWFVFRYGPSTLLNADSSSCTTSSISTELRYTFNKIMDVQLNESSWNYLRGWADSYYNKKCAVRTIVKAVIPEEVRDGVEEEGEGGKGGRVKWTHVMMIMTFCKDLLYREITSSSSSSSVTDNGNHGKDVNNDDDASEYEDCDDESDEDNDKIKQQHQPTCYTSTTTTTSTTASNTTDNDHPSVTNPTTTTATSATTTTTATGATTGTSTSIKTVMTAVRVWNPFALSLLADLREKENTHASLSEAKIYMEQLLIVDAIRSKSWKLRIQRIEDKMMDGQIL